MMGRWGRWLQAACGGGVAGWLGQILLLRLNPELEPGPTAAAIALAAGASWGALLGTVLLRPVVAFLVRLRPPAERDRAWVMPGLLMVVCVLAAVASRLNADHHREYLSGTAHRLLGQDAVAWLALGLLLLGAGKLLRRHEGLRWLLLPAAFALPLARVALQPSPAVPPLAVEVRPLGRPARPLLVVGLEGFDANLMLQVTASGRFGAFARFRDSGAWGRLRTYRPYLRESLWTTAASGVLPRRHGVKARWSWRLPYLKERARLLPTPAEATQWLLPFWLTSREIATSSAVPALWQRTAASGVPTMVLGWPGAWSSEAAVQATPAEDAGQVLEPFMRRSLEVALGPFPADRNPVLDAVTADAVTLARARAALAADSGTVWIHLRSLSTARRRLEPWHARDAREREVLELVLEQLDGGLQSTLDAAGPDLVTALVSPYGLEQPGVGERVLRLVGLGGSWRTSAASCPDGALAVLGPGVARGARFERAQIPDVVPTLCYLLDLPVAQYMEGRVVLEAIDPSHLATHPLQVVD